MVKEAERKNAGISEEDRGHFFEWMVVGKSREEDDQERGKLTE